MANSTDGATSPKTLPEAKPQVIPKPDPASKTTKPPGGAGHNGAGAGDDGDGVPASKRPVDVDTKDDKKMVTFHVMPVVRADLHVKASVVQPKRSAVPVDPYSGMVGQCPTTFVGSVYH